MIEQLVTVLGEMPEGEKHNCILYYVGQPVHDFTCPHKQNIQCRKKPNKQTRQNDWGSSKILTDFLF